MQLARSNRIRVALGSLLVLLICQRLPAQEPQIDTLADQMASSLSHAKQKTVMVFDFVGTDEMNALGQRLAADFRAALGKSAPELRVEDRSQLLELIHKSNFGSSDVRDADTASWLLRQTGTDAAILGALSSKNGALKIEVQAFRVTDVHRIVKFETSMALSDDLKALIGKTEERGVPSLPMAGKAGYSVPRCISCAPAILPEEAAKANYQGTVLLELTVDEDGHVKDITVKKGLPYGVTEHAIAAVQGWRFKPATGPDGKRTAVRTIVEITFHLH